MIKIKSKRRKGGGYTNIPLPNELVKQIDNEIKHGECGYKTKTEFVKEAVREKLRELINLKALKSGIKKQS